MGALCSRRTCGADHIGVPQWVKPKPFRWDHARFGLADAAVAAPDEPIDITVVKQNRAANGLQFVDPEWRSIFNENDSAGPCGRCTSTSYPLKFRNASNDVHPLHLHRHSFELTRVGGRPTAGVIKDVVMLGGFQEVEFDFVADDPDLTLFHCHQQLHMDFGFMAFFNYAATSGITSRSRGRAKTAP